MWWLRWSRDKNSWGSSNSGIPQWMLYRVTSSMASTNRKISRYSTTWWSSATKSSALRCVSDSLTAGKARKSSGTWREALRSTWMEAHVSRENQSQQRKFCNLIKFRGEDKPKRPKCRLLLSQASDLALRLLIWHPVVTKWVVTPSLMSATTSMPTLQPSRNSWRWTLVQESM